MWGPTAVPKHACEAVTHVEVHLGHAAVVGLGDQQRAAGRYTHAASEPVELHVPGAGSTANHTDLHAVTQVVAVQLFVALASNDDEVLRNVHTMPYPFTHATLRSNRSGKVTSTGSRSAVAAAAAATDPPAAMGTQASKTSPEATTACNGNEGITTYAQTTTPT